ncbi:hypothetical protein ACFO1V_06300 [Daeguia caeni]|uniref:Uncharacterized protein n=1 Tax=Daeguia caeni TaxID=439612 RepID=A0ABV9H345_9HYPH
MAAFSVKAAIFFALSHWKQARQPARDATGEDRTFLREKNAPDT